MTTDGFPAKADIRNGYVWHAAKAPVWLIVTVALIGLLPFLLTPVLPLTDFYAHIVRYYVLAHIDSRPDLQENYTAAWQLLPNLGLDLVVTGLMKLLPPLLVAKLVGIAIVAAPFFGTLALARALHGHVPVMAPLLAGTLAFNAILLWGFANFLLGFGLLLVNLALWITLAEKPRAQWVLSLVLGVVLFFIHGLAFAIWGLLLGTVELMRAIDRRDLAPLSLLWRILRLASLAVLPALMFLRMPTSQAEGGVTVAFDNLERYAETGRLGERVSAEVLTRIDSLLRVADSSHPLLDRGLGLLLWGGLAAALALGVLKLDRRLWLAVALMAVLVCATPPSLFGVGYVAIRMPLVLLALLSAGVTLGAARGRAWILPMMTVIFAAHLGLVGASWFQQGQSYRAYLAALDKTPTGALGSVAYFDGTGNRDSLAVNCKPFSPLLLLLNGTAVATFAFETQQPIRLDGVLERATEARVRTDLAPTDSLSNPRSRAHILERLRGQGFDTVVACDRQPNRDTPPGFEKSAAHVPWTLYRRLP